MSTESTTSPKKKVDHYWVSVEAVREPMKVKEGDDR